MSYHPDPLIRDYEDRGMAKWMGFYLSEHTAEIQAEKKERATLWFRKPKMSEESIAEILEKSYSTRVYVEIQLNELNPEGFAYADIVGIVEGFKDTCIFVSHPTTGLQFIRDNSINHIRVLHSTKWSDLS
ncbi:hypothetical protein P7D52_11440 [Enterococcus dongliensis]|nr:hypothetical protein [Enterococcus dongliensis]